MVKKKTILLFFSKLFLVFMRSNHIQKLKITFFSEVLVSSDKRPYRNCLVPRRLSRCESGGRAREKEKGKGCETSGRFCFQDGRVFNGG